MRSHFYYQKNGALTKLKPYVNIFSKNDLLSYFNIIQGNFTHFQRIFTLSGLLGITSH